MRQLIALRNFSSTPLLLAAGAIIGGLPYGTALGVGQAFEMPSRSSSGPARRLNESGEPVIEVNLNKGMARGVLP